MRKSNQRGPKVIPRLLFQLLSAMITIQAVDIAVYTSREVMKALPLLGCGSFHRSQAGGAGWLEMEKDPCKSAVADEKAGQEDKQSVIMEVIPSLTFRKVSSLLSVRWTVYISKALNLVINSDQKGKTAKSLSNIWRKWNTVIIFFFFLSHDTWRIYFIVAPNLLEIKILL